MLKIVLVETGSGAARLELDGQVIGPWVDELERACERVLAVGVRLTLDLAEVSFVGQEGARLLGSLADRGVALSRCSPFVAELLRAVACGRHACRTREVPDHAG